MKNRIDITSTAVMKFLLFACVVLVVDASLQRPLSQQVPNIPVATDVGEPLILTPYVEKGNIEEGQKLAKVKGLPVDLLSYAGFFTVNSDYNSNLYFWFFPAVNNSEEAPMVLWLQGGPGTSSLNGLFVENGPFYVDDSLQLKSRPISWSNISNLIYIDNPIGTGFSFTDDVRGYARDENDVARDLYNALVQFFTLFPQYQKNKFFITGESYAGKYVPAISYKIHQENLKGNFKINFKGMAIGNGVCDPISMLDHGTYLYNVGLLDYKEAQVFHEIEALVKDYIDKKEWLNAIMVSSTLFINPYSSLYVKFTGITDLYNYLYATDPTAEDPFRTYIQLPNIRRILHVGNETFSNPINIDVFIYLLEDMMQSVKPWVEELLDNNYKVLLYSGQVDVIVSHTLTQNFIRNLQWKGAAEYNSSEKKIWKVGNQVAGYAKHAGNFGFVIVRNAGHMVPHDQPEWAYDMISRFLSGKSF